METRVAHAHPEKINEIYKPIHLYAKAIAYEIYICIHRIDLQHRFRSQ